MSNRIVLPTHRGRCAGCGERTELWIDLCPRCWASDDPPASVFVEFSPLLDFLVSPWWERVSALIYTGLLLGYFAGLLWIGDWWYRVTEGFR